MQLSHSLPERRLQLAHLAASLQLSLTSLPESIVQFQVQPIGHYNWDVPESQEDTQDESRGTGNA
jgi:hypothetical protein